MRHGLPWLSALLLFALGTETAEVVATGGNGAKVDLVLTADKAKYRPGEPIALTLQVVNRSPHAVTLQFRTAQRHDLIVQDAQGREVWRRSAGEMVAQVLGEETLLPGGKPLTYRVTLREHFPAGRYTIIGLIPADPGPISATIGIQIE